jgi:hypothetical protein
MGKYEKLLLKILRGTSDNNINFNDLLNLLLKMDFKIKIKGSHHNFRKSGIIEKLNLQKDGNLAKTYQVKQVRNIITKYGLSLKEDKDG